MNEKRNFISVLFCIGVLLFSGCRTTTDANIIADSARSSQRLEDAFSSLIGTVDHATERLDNIIGTARLIQDDGDRLEYIINCYDEELARLRAEIDYLRTQLRNSEANSDSNGSGFSVRDTSSNSGGDFMGKGN